jgi:hypothetical protein
MTLTRIRDRLYLFGGSGPAAKCFDDLQILDLKEMCWYVWGLKPSGEGVRKTGC